MLITVRRCRVPYQNVDCGAAWPSSISYLLRTIEFHGTRLFR